LRALVRGVGSRSSRGSPRVTDARAAGSDRSGAGGSLDGAVASRSTGPIATEEPGAALPVGRAGCRILTGPGSRTATKASAAPFVIAGMGSQVLLGLLPRFDDRPAAGSGGVRTVTERACPLVVAVVAVVAVPGGASLGGDGHPGKGSGTRSHFPQHLRSRHGRRREPLDQIVELCSIHDLPVLPRYAILERLGIGRLCSGGCVFFALNLPASGRRDSRPAPKGDGTPRANDGVRPRRCGNPCLPRTTPILRKWIRPAFSGRVPLPGSLSCPWPSGPRLSRGWGCIRPVPGCDAGTVAIRAPR
jgi:hypothetical protein